MSKMYEELAWWWPLLSPPAEYAEEAAFYGQALAAAADAPIRLVLELGSGGGHNASHMKKAFGPMVLVEPSDAMRAMSAALNPDCEHVKGDMRSVRLGRQFDAVFVHDAVCYMLSDGRSAAGDRDRVRPLPARRRRAVRAGSRARELRAGDRPRRS